MSSKVRYSELPRHSDGESDGNDDSYIEANSNLGQQAAEKTQRKSRQKSTRLRDIELHAATHDNALVFCKSHSQKFVIKERRIFIVVIATVIVAAILIGVAVGVFHRKIPSTTVGTEWTVLYDDYASESCARLVDVNKDGAMDAIIAAALTISNCSSTSQNCYFVMALDGKTGKELWRITTRSAVFTMNCVDVDVNLDGVPDCILNGRYGTLVAVNPLTGIVLWRVNTTQLSKVYNVFQVAVVQDLDDDRVLDFVIANGGNQSYSPEDHDRDPGRLLLISGRTGHSIGTYMDMPNRRETYMSPIIYTAIDGSVYVLFGSGGETVSGAFMAISLQDLYHKLTASVHPRHRPTFSGTNDAWAQKRDKKTGIITIHRSRQKGFIVPPVIADFDHDDIDDIFVTVHDGVVVVYSGKTLDVIWSRFFDGCEIYSSPAPGYFNDDDYLDVLIHTNRGAWPDYNRSQTVILSGRNGDLLWSLYTPLSELSSDLVLRAASPPNAAGTHTRDVFIFSVRGVSLDPAHHTDHSHSHSDHSHSHSDHSHSHSDHSHSHSDMHQGHKHQRRHIIGAHGDCNKQAWLYTARLVMMDRFSARQPWILGDLSAELYHYNLTEEDEENMRMDHLRLFHKDITEPFVRGPFCTLLSSVERNAGAIGDLDGDGSLSFVRIGLKSGELQDARGNFVRSKFKTIVKKIQISRQIARERKILGLAATGSVITDNDESHSLKDARFLPYKQQLWTSYMGRYENGHFRH